MYIPLNFNMLIWSMYCYVNLLHEINFIIIINTTRESMPSQ